MVPAVDGRLTMELAKVARVAAIIFRDGDSEATRSFVEQVFAGTNRDEYVLAGANSTSSFSAIERDVFLRHTAYVHRDQRAGLDDQLLRVIAKTGATRYALPPDHLAQELLILATLLSHHPIDDAMQFATNVVASWIVPVAAVVSRESSETDRAAMGLCLDLLETLHGTISGDIGAAGYNDEPRQEPTDWNSLVRWLPYPELSGMLITRTQLSGLAHSLDVPVGFGSRERMIETLIDSALRYDGTALLKKGLISTVDRELDMFGEIETRLSDSRFTSPWMGRLRVTRELIVSMD